MVSVLSFYNKLILTLIFTLTGTLNRIRVKNSVGNIGIFDTKRVFCANKGFKNTIYSTKLEFKSLSLRHKNTTSKWMWCFYVCVRNLKIKCGADEHRRRGLDRAEPIFSFPLEMKMQTNPSRSHF